MNLEKGVTIMKKIALVLAGGVGNRMKETQHPKQYIMVKDRPIIDYSLCTLQEHDLIDGILIVADPSWDDFIDEWLEKSNITKFIGYAQQGKTRQLSIFSGLKAIKEVSPDAEYVLVHDAVRPMLPKDLITRCMENLEQSPCVMPVLPIKDTCYQSKNGKSVDGFISRDQLFAGQAPEAFHFKKYLELHETTSEQDILLVSGSTELAYKGGWDVLMVTGAEINLKITTQEDLLLFKRMIGC